MRGIFLFSEFRLVCFHFTSASGLTELSALLTRSHNARMLAVGAFTFHKRMSAFTTVRSFADSRHRGRAVTTASAHIVFIHKDSHGIIISNKL